MQRALWVIVVNSKSFQKEITEHKGEGERVGVGRSLVTSCPVGSERERVYTETLA